MEKTQKEYKTVKITNEAFTNLCKLQLYFLSHKRINVNKKRLLGWALRKAFEDLKEYDKQK